LVKIASKPQVGLAHFLYWFCGVISSGTFLPYLREDVNSIVVLWLVTNRFPWQWNLGYGAAHNLSVRTNNALGRTVICDKPRRNRLENRWDQPGYWLPHSDAGMDRAAAGRKRKAQLCYSAAPLFGIMICLISLSRREFLDRLAVAD